MSLIMMTPSPHAGQLQGQRYLRTAIDMSTPNPFIINTSAPTRFAGERLHGQPQAVTNVHKNTKFVYVEQKKDCPPLSISWLDQTEPCQERSILTVTLIQQSGPEARCMDYLLSNSDKSYQTWVQAHHLVRMINRGMLRIISPRSLSQMSHQRS